MIVFIFIFALIIGSFLNVCIYRIPRSESIAFPGSHCTACGNPIKSYDLIPVISFLLLRGKCRMCKESISIRYPLVELLTAVLITFQAWRYGITAEFFYFAAMTSILIIITMIDLDRQIIPDGLIIALGILGAMYLFTVQLPQYGARSLLQNAIGFAVGGLFFLLIAVVSNGGMGGGDIKLMAVLGLWFGWQKLLALMLVTFISGAVISIILLLLKIKKMKDGIPFGPFIAFAAYIVSIYGTDIIMWYFNI